MSGDTSEQVRSTNQIGHDFGRKYEEINIVISDLHLGEGPQTELEYGGRRGFSRAMRVILYRVFGIGSPHEVVNNDLEEFHYDHEFADFLGFTAERYRATDQLRLRLLGDVFDPLTVAWEGRYQDPPYEDVAVAKLVRIIAGHPDFFRALKDFISQSNCRLDIFVGNHDLFLVWPAVQRLLRSTITGDDSELDERLRIIDQRDRYRLKERDVLYEHGNFAEPHNSVKAQDTIVLSILGQNLRRPILNAPYGNYMFVDMVTRIKNSNPLVGRIRSDRRVWNHAFRYRWLWGLKAGLLLVWHFIYSHLFAVADIRRKATLRKILDIVAWTTSNQSVDGYAMRLLERNDDVKVVVLGHSHNWRRMSSDHGTYLNVGNWSCSYRLEEPAFELKWSRLPRVEFAWRALRHFFLTGEVRFAWRMTKFVGALALISAMFAFVFGAFDGGAWTFWPLQPIVTKVLVGLALTFILVAGVFRLFSTEPSIKSDTHFTFGLIGYRHDGKFRADLMEYDAKKRTANECV
ncbi:MAG: hypothetical protein V1738_00550 [Patescibacteria group bacterium]